MLANLYRLLPPGGMRLLASAILFLMGGLIAAGSGNGVLATAGLAGALAAIAIVVASAGDRRDGRR